MVQGMPALDPLYVRRQPII